MLEQVLANLVEEKRQENVPDFLIVNFLKEYLQYPVLDWLYKHEPYRKFIFTGGSCLRICHGLPRLSEDLDFDIEAGQGREPDPAELAERLTGYFRTKYLLEPEAKVQADKRLYLKFPVLYKLGLSYGGGSDLLYVKLEPEARSAAAGRTEI